MREQVRIVTRRKGGMFIKGLLASVLSVAAVTSLGADVPAAGELKSGIDRGTFDMGVKPGDDFFQYVNGGWIKGNPIPPEYSRWGAFTQLRDENMKELRAILDGLVKSDILTPEQMKLRDIYQAAMNEAQRNAQGVTALAPEFARIDKMATREDLVAELAHLRSMGMGEIFGISVGQDAKHSDQYAVELYQGGLTLPEVSYYTAEGEDSKLIRQQFHDHMVAMLKLLGDAPETASTEADAVLTIETALAKASRNPVALRDQEANYNRRTVAQLAELTPNVKWDAYLKELGLTDVKDVIIGQPEFFKGLNGMLETVPVADWKAYLRWHLIHAMSGCVSTNFEDENFHFFGEILHGTKQQQARWKRAIGAVSGEMGEALGHLYVEKYFTAAAKQRMETMVSNLMAAYKERIETREWMGPETKKQALIKLAAVQRKIGFPDKWRDYSELDVKEDSYVLNVMRGMAFESKYRLSRLGKPVDHAEWHMTPQTINAYYSGNMNEIVFPAGILQPPFFDAKADDAVNYGGIGTVIGHEITHGFDDQGSRSDAVGNLRDWWTADDRARFTALTEKLVKQYDACEPLPGLRVNGKLTLGENLADLGGVAISYAAYQKSLGGKPAPVIDGFTGAQRFFIGFAQVWRDNSREASQKVSLRTDPHSPGQYRTIVPLSNLQEFYDAFGIKEGDKMYRKPEERVEVW